MVANQRQGFREIRHCDWLLQKVEDFRRPGRLVDISYYRTWVIFALSMVQKQPITEEYFTEFASLIGSSRRLGKDNPKSISKYVI